MRLTNKHWVVLLCVAFFLGIMGSLVFTWSRWISGGMLSGLAQSHIEGSARLQHGDFSAFVVSAIVTFGGHTVTNAPLRTVEAHWTVKSDANGFRADVAGARFAEIDGVMQQAFGKPKLSVAANLDGQPHRVWGAVDIGVAVQLIGRPDGAEVICVRGVR